MDAVPPPSPALLAANRRLHEFRRQAPGPERWPADPPSGAADSLPETNPAWAGLPAHLGWGSAALTAALAANLGRPAPAEAVAPNEARAWPTESSPAAHEPPADRGAVGAAAGFVKLYPALALRLLRQEQAAAGRVWLLARHLDRQGTGWMGMEQLTRCLTAQDSDLRLCSPRQLRNLLRQGEGVFWQRAGGRLWLRSTAKVAYALGVERLTGRPVDLPVTALLQGIGDFRAHLYASFHSGRAKETPDGRAAMPIARQTMTAVSGVGRRSQQAYERRLRLPVQANFAVGEAADSQNSQERAWQQGRALFELKDYRGRQGKKGKRYLAWQLPNCYSACHAHRPKGRQRRINRELKALVLKGTPGNVEGTSETPRLDLTRRYYPTGPGTAGAVQAFGRPPAHALYWRSQSRHSLGQQAENQRFNVWQVISGG